MEFGRNLPIPGALITSLLLSIFLFWVTGNMAYPMIGEVIVAHAISQEKNASETDNHPVITSFIEAANFVLNISSQSQASDQNDIRAEDPIPVAEEQITYSDQTNTSCEVSGSYPDKILKWCDLITQSAHQYGIDPDLLAALIWQESGGNPQAYSHSGAVGLMQVMPRDGLAASFQCPNGPCFSNRPTTNQLKDPDFNVTYGSKMLSGLISRRGSLREGLKSYGPADVGYSYADKVIALYQDYGE